MGKTYMAKTSLGDFKITTPENPLLSQQAITNKGIPIPYTNLQLNTLSLHDALPIWSGDLKITQ